MLSFGADLLLLKDVLFLELGLEPGLELGLELGLHRSGVCFFSSSFKSVIFALSLCSKLCYTIGCLIS